jgi:uncharacterized protein (DUF2267 family)
LTTQAFYRRVRQAGGVVSRDWAKRATSAVFHALRDRLTPREAEQVLAQLPAELKAVWSEGETASRKPSKMHRDEFFERVKQEAGGLSAREARSMTLAVFAALKEQLSPGEAEDVLGQLPKDLKKLWVEAPEAEERPGWGRGMP